jgi:zinc/manganese transport system substrate-binding protein
VTPGVVRVVAGENFWGNIAAQIGGRHARVTSIITSPNADPHLYEADVDARRQPATAQDRRHRTGQALPGGTVE